MFIVPFDYEILIILIIILFSCSDDSPSNDTYINPPSWIQGEWLREDFIELNLEYGYKFTNDDFCNISLGEKKCSEALDLISVYEEISDDRYLLVTTNNTETVEFAG